MSDDVEAVQACLRDDAATLRDDNKECEIASNMDAAATPIGRLAAELAAAYARIEALREHALKYIEPLTDSMVSDTEQAIDRTLERHGDRHAQVQGVYPALLFSAKNAIKTMRLARDRARKELAAANEAREKAERERDVARENARVRSGEALDYYSAMLNFAHEFGAKDGDNMIEVIGNGIDALRAEGERLREAIRHLLTVVQVDPDCAECAAAEELIAAIDAARKEA